MMLQVPAANDDLQEHFSAQSERQPEHSGESIYEHISLVLFCFPPSIQTTQTHCLLACQSTHFYIMTTVATKAQTAWVNTFDDGPYTSFKMMDYMLYKANKASYEDLAKNPKVAKNISKQDIEKDDMTKGPLFDTWGSKTGRCTSFAIKITTELVKANPGVFDFKVYDLKGHRVARCMKTGVLIDSSSWVGAFVLKEGEWKTFEDGTSSAKWKWINKESKFKRDGIVVRTYWGAPFSIAELFQFANANVDLM